MVTKTAPNENRTQLDDLLNTWETRWRTRRVVLYLPRVLMSAIGFGLIVTLLLALLRLFSPVVVVGIISGSIAAAVVLISGGLRLFGKQGIAAARQFDRVFGLQERVSTAIELMDGRIQTAPELAHLQVTDAFERAKDIDPRKHIKIEIRWLEWLGSILMLVLLIVVFGLYLFFGSQGGTGLAEETEAAIASAADEVRDITEDVATDSGLTDEERQTLLESLEVRLDELTDKNTTPENSFVAMSELQTDLSDLAEEIRDETAATQAGLDNAAEALQNPSTSNTNQDAQQEAPNLGQELQNLQDSLLELTPEQAAALQQQLEAAAQALENSPELAEQLRQALENMQAGDLNMTQEDLQKALENLQSLENFLQQRNESAQALDEASQNAEQSAEDIAQAEAQQQQDGEAAQNQEQTGQQQEGQFGQGQQQDSAQGEPSTSSQQQGSSAVVVPGDNPAAPQAMIEGQQQGQQDSQNKSQQDSGESSGGAGEGEANARQEGSGQQQSELGSNNADGQGEIEYEAIYAPNSTNTEGTDNIILQADASDAPAAEGDFQDNPTGEVTVPYNRVFRSYENAANHALENDYVPLGMQDVVRDYFSALQPEGN